MENLLKKKKLFKVFLIILPILIVLSFVALIIYTILFNKIVHTSTYEDTDSKSYLSIVARTDSGSSWIKQGFPLNGEEVDLNAQIYDSFVDNTSKYTIKYWTETITVQGDCYISNAWNGEVEIHQHVGTADEKVQSICFSNYDIEDVTLDYVQYDGDTLIPLSAGDYFIYLPAESYDEYPISKGKEDIRSNGFILDFMDSPDLTSYSFNYLYHRNLTSGWSFYVIIGMSIAWFVLLAMYHVAKAIYRSAQKEMELKKSGISSMSDIYAIIYIVDLVKDEIIPVKADAKSEEMRPRNIGANEQFHNLFEFDSDEAHMELVQSFANLTTLAERLSDRDTVVCEYISNMYGWCRLRFFAMDRVEGMPLEKVVFTIQVVNDEKAELEANNARVEKAEMENKAKSTFLANMSHEIRTPINTVLGLNTMILRESKEKSIIAYAKDIKSAANMLLSLINSILDFSKLEAGKMELVPTEYSFRQTLADVRSMVMTKFEAKDLKLDFEVSPNIPNRLYGDDVRIKQIMINLLTNAAKYTDHGGAKMSVFGKQTGDKLHLLVSVKDTGMGIREEERQHLTERFSRLDEKKNHKIEGTGIGLNLVSGLLALMDSELKVVSEYGKGSEFYFEIDQKVMDSTPIGTLDFSEKDFDGEDYAATFQAPDAKVLAVDDNPLNLTVIENLLKETKLQIEKAVSGKQALAMTGKTKYDLIFMDHMMPEMDGIQTLQAIRAEEGNPNRDTKIIMLTANALKGAEEEYHLIGFADFVPKPIQPEILESKIMLHLDPSKYKKGSFKSMAQDDGKNQSVDLPKINGLDATYGLQHTGGYESLMKVMEQFDAVAMTDLEELLSYFERLKDDPKNSNILADYRIKVHAMKSSARVMGAIALSGLAETLENAARNGNVDAIVAITPHFEQDWTAMKAELDSYFGAENQGDTQVDKKVLDELLHQLETSMNAYDVKNADQVVKELEQFAWDEKQQAIFAKLKTAVANLDADQTAALCRELSES